MCNCSGTRGVAVSATVRDPPPWQALLDVDAIFRGVRPLATQPGEHLGLSSYYIRSGFSKTQRHLLDAKLFVECFAFLRSERFDDLMVYRNGMQGNLVRHSQVNHPQPYRVEYGVCHGSGRHSTANLTSYPSTKCPFRFWSKRHMPLPPFVLMRHVCHRLVAILPRCVHNVLPNSITVHWYPSKDTPGEHRGDTRVGYHTDSFCAPGQSTEQLPGSPVISISWGETMWFWVRGQACEAVVTELEHGSVWIWSEQDDHSGVKHSVQFPSGDANRSGLHHGEGRWVVIGRWMTQVREYDTTYPHRVAS